MAAIRGPFAFVYFRPSSGSLWFGRDFFGRHSLLVETGENRFTLSSVGHKSLGG
jgi:asparagine synthetase B (glutamine-hydrolysing)